MPMVFWDVFDIKDPEFYLTSTAHVKAALCIIKKNFKNNGLQKSGMTIFDGWSVYLQNIIGDGKSRPAGWQKWIQM